MQSIQTQQAWGNTEVCWAAAGSVGDERQQSWQQQKLSNQLRKLHKNLDVLRTNPDSALLPPDWTNRSEGSYVLNLNKLVAEDATMDRTSLPQVMMPNRDGFIPEKPFVNVKRQAGAKKP